MVAERLRARLLALPVEDTDARQASLVALAREADADATAAVAPELVASDDSSQRLVGALLLSARTTVDGLERNRVEDDLLRELSGDVDAEVAATALSGLGRLGDVADLERLIARARDHDAAVREAVAFALILVLEANHNADAEGRYEAEAAVVGLADDADEDVRSWALYGIGIALQLRSAGALAVMRRHRSDAHHESRCEALEGLALAGDRDALLESLACCDLDLELLAAAVAAGGEDVRRALVAIRTSGGWTGAQDDLDDAIRRCAA